MADTPEQNRPFFRAAVNAFRRKAPGILIGLAIGFVVGATLPFHVLWLGPAVLFGVIGAAIGGKTLGDLSFLVQQDHKKSKAPKPERAPAKEKELDPGVTRQQARAAAIEKMALNNDRAPLPENYHAIELENQRMANAGIPPRS